MIYNKLKEIKVLDYCLKKGHNTRGYATQGRKHVYGKQLRLYSTWEVEVTKNMYLTIERCLCFPFTFSNLNDWKNRPVQVFF